MKNNTMFAAALSVVFAAGTAAAADLDAPPPYAGDVDLKQLQAPQPARTLPPKPPEEGMSLAPSKADMEKARQDREKGVVPNIPSNRTNTKIEEVRDQNNNVTSYVVTPGSTQIPYKIENLADRPIDTTPGGNPSGTLGTPKFIEFSW